MDIELLKTFLEVTRTRHFGRAADNLFLTPAAVSARIRQLEQSLGVTLFYRTRGNIQTTADGQRLLPHAHRLLESWAEARRELMQESESAQQLSLGATPGLWHFALGELTSRLQQALPDVNLRAEAYPQEELIERLLAEQLDMVVLYDLPGDAALRSRRVGQLKLGLLSSQPGLSVKTALAGDYLYVDWGAAFALFHARRFGEVRPRLYTNQASVALETLWRSPASAYLPAQPAGPLSKDLADGRLHSVEAAPEFSRPLYAVYRADQEFSALVRQVTDLLDQIESF